MEEDFSPSFLLQYLSFAWNKSQQFIESDSRVTILSNIAQHLRYNKDKIARVTVPQRVKFFGLQMKILGTIVEDVIVSRDQDLARLILRSKQIRRHFALGDGPSLDEFVVNAFQLAWHDVQQAVELAETVEVEERGESSYETAKFCDLLLRSVEGKSEDWKHELENFASAMTEATLQSISLGVRKATPLFPRLLQLLEAFPCISATLQTKVGFLSSILFFQIIPVFCRRKRVQRGCS
ncbi:hypothetical protein DFJ73DRAFT_104664 [Zopfochytrium polystomum]|nr:hypothetical protein DFJ73DRAFT_104664 [Zopfochytrium polystomum]